MICPCTLGLGGSGTEGSVQGICGGPRRPHLDFPQRDSFLPQGRSAEFAMRHVLGMASPTKPSDANAASLGTFKPDGSEGEAPNGSEWLRCLHLSHLRSHLEEGRANTLVYALGFARRPLPDLSLDGHPVSVLPGFAGFDHGEGGCGQLMAVMPADLSAPETASGRIPMQGLPRAYGVGLAFPAVDPSNSSYEAASIPIFIQRAVAIANDILGQ